MTTNAIKTEANRRKDSWEHLTLKAYGYHLVLKDHNHCIQRNRLCSPRLRRETRSNTVCNEKRTKHTKKSMLFPNQDSSSAFAVLPGPLRDTRVSRMDGETGEKRQRDDVYAWGRGKEGRNKISGSCGDDNEGKRRRKKKDGWIGGVRWAPIQNSFVALFCYDVNKQIVFKCLGKMRHVAMNTANTATLLCQCDGVLPKRK